MLANRIKELSPSATIAMSEKASELKSKGIDVINLSLGEPDFNTPEFVKEAAKQAIDDNYSSYPPVGGYPDLKQAVCDKLKKENNLTYSPSQIVVSTGAKHSLYNILMASINPGDEVILLAPYWVSYYQMVEMVGGIPVVINSNVHNDYKTSAQEIAKAITPKTKAIMFNSPSNPSGSCYSKGELEAIAEVLKKEDILVISDEIYEYITYDGFEPVSIASFDGMYDKTVIVNGMSKGFAMTGWRLGYLAGPEWLAKGVQKFQGQVTSAATSITQRATIAALNGGKTKVAYMLEAFKERKEYMVDALSKLNGIIPNNPQGAFYVFPDVSSCFGKTHKGNTINNANEFCMILLEEYHVATVPGDAFGNPDSIRLSYANSLDQIKLACERIETMINHLN